MPGFVMGRATRQAKPDRTADRGATHDRAERGASALRGVAEADPGGLLSLQRSIGNAATVAYLQRMKDSRQPRSAVHRAISTPGRPLDVRTQRAMERHLGANLSGVSLHLDRSSTQSVSAAAYTVGSDVVLDPDRFSPRTPEGDHLVAHELTHVVQQRRGPVAGTPAAGGVSLSDPGDRHELEAERSAEAYDRGSPFRVSTPAAAAAPGWGQGAAAVQRFPATALSAPTKWSMPRPGVMRPGEGMSGGIYILSAAEENPEIAKVIVKPVFKGTQYDETGETLQFGDRFLKMIGANSPVSRVIKVGTPEYAELIGLIRPFQPQPEQRSFQRDNFNPDARDWWDVSEAQSLVVMSEVPKAHSAKSYAEKAARDDTAKSDLFDAVFTDSFVGELARLAVGDLLIGNPDRLTRGKINLGNLMISVQQGKSSLHAIDTGVMLPKARPPEDIVKYGGYYGMGGKSAFKTYDTPSSVLEDFYGVLISNLQDAAPPRKEGDPEPAWEMFEKHFREQHDKMVNTFMQSWNSVLTEVSTLLSTKEGRQQLKSLTGGYEASGSEDKLSHATLKANLVYLSGRSENKTHEESAGEAAAYQAYRQLLDFDPTAYEDLETGSTRPWLAGRASSDVQSAKLESMDGLPRWEDLGQAVSVRPPSLNRSKYDQWCFKADAARRRVEELGTKRKGGKETTRNRVKAGNYVANTYLEAIGSRMALLRYNQLRQEMKNLSVVSGGKLDRLKLNKVAAVGEAMFRAKSVLERTLASYEESLGAAGSGVKKIRKFPAGTDLSAKLNDAANKVRTDLPTVKQSIEAESPRQLLEALQH